MKKRFGLLVLLFSLIGCSKNSAAGGTSGKVDCYTIKVTQGASTIFNGKYSWGYSKVFEFRSGDNNKIYVSSDCKYEGKNLPIRVYKDKYAYVNDYIQYSYERFVGYLKTESNYYLNLSDKIIDSEVKWSEVSDDVNPENLEGCDNKEAYKCAKTNYYTSVDSGYAYNEYCFIYLDSSETSIERHVYTMLGEDSVITYQAKWF